MIKAVVGIHGSVELWCQCGSRAGNNLLLTSSMFQHQTNFILILMQPEPFTEKVEWSSDHESLMTRCHEVCSGPEQNFVSLQLRSALDRIEELEATNSHLSKRVEKMKANRNALLAQQWCLFLLCMQHKTGGVNWAPRLKRQNVEIHRSVPNNLWSRRCSHPSNFRKQGSDPARWPGTSRVQHFYLGQKMRWPCLTWSTRLAVQVC